MSIKDKYKPVLNLMAELKAEEVEIKEDRGTLNIHGSVKDEHSKKLIMDKIDEVNIYNGWDIDLNLEIKN